MLDYLRDTCRQSSANNFGHASVTPMKSQKFLTKSAANLEIRTLNSTENSRRLHDFVGAVEENSYVGSRSTTKIWPLNAGLVAANQSIDEPIVALPIITTSKLDRIGGERLGHCDLSEYQAKQIT